MPAPPRHRPNDFFVWNIYAGSVNVPDKEVTPLAMGLRLGCFSLRSWVRRFNCFSLYIDFR